MSDNIPFLDLVGLHRDIEEELVTSFRDAVRTCQFINGPEVEKFEQEFAAFCGARYCVGLNSGTDALRFGLIAAGIKPGDIVLTVPNTFIATTEAISQAGARFEFLEINERTYTLDPLSLANYLETQCHQDSVTGYTVHTGSGRPVTGIVPVHLYGQVADMDPILALAEQHRLVIIEDACQAHGAEYFSRSQGRWIKAGLFGRAAAFSFYPGKNLGACGDAGALTTNDPEIAAAVRMLREHGQRKKYMHEIEGYNGRIDAVQASGLRIKLRRLASWNTDRRKIAKRYGQLLGSVRDVILPFEPEYSQAVYHLFVIRAQRRDALQAFLSQRGIATGLHYPVPLHLQQAYADRAGDKFPISEQIALELLSLPMFPGMTEHQQQRVADGIVAFFDGSSH